MEALQIEAKQKTPYVHFEHTSGVLEIRGMSYAENSLEFYKPVMAWVEDYLENPSPKTVINLHFQYFNTSSAKCIMDLLELLSQLSSSGKSLEINWYYERNDEEMFEAGQNYSELLEIPFNLKVK